MLRILAWYILFPIVLVSTVTAQQVDAGKGAWGMKVRTVLSGASHSSEPADYTIYSGLSIGATLTWRWAEVAALEFAFRTESREVEGPSGLEQDHRLGAFELLPVTLTGQWRPLGARGSRVQPYVGGGIGVTVVWEKSGILDRTHPPAQYVPVLQVGADVGLTSRAAFNLDFRWNPLEIEFTDYEQPVPVVDIDPLTVALGLGFMF